MDETKINRDKCKAVEEERSSCTEMTMTMTKKMKRGGQRRRKTKEDKRIRRTEMKRMEEEENGGRGRGCGLGYLGPQTNRRWCPRRCHRLPNTDAAFWRATSTCTGSRVPHSTIVPALTICL